MKKLVALMAAGVLLVATATLVIWLQLRSERERGAELASLAATPAMVEMPEVRVPPPGEQLAATAVAGDSPVTAPSTPPATAAPSRAVPTPQGPTPAPAGTARAADPMAAMMRSMMREAYPDLAAELDLTPAQAEQFLDLFAKQQAETGTQFMGLMGGSAVDAGKRMQLQQQMLDKELANEAELKKVLGSKYPRWEEYRATADARQQVNALRTTLAAAGRPLTEPQSQALITAFAADAARSRREDQAWVASDAARNSPNLMRERTERQIEDQRRYVDLAAPHLDATQLEHFRRQNEQTLAMAASMLGMMGGEK